MQKKNSKGKETGYDTGSSYCSAFLRTSCFVFDKMAGAKKKTVREGRLGVIQVVAIVVLF